MYSLAGTMLKNICFVFVLGCNIIITVLQAVYWLVRKNVPDLDFVFVLGCNIIITVLFQL